MTNFGGALQSRAFIASIFSSTLVHWRQVTLVTRSFLTGLSLHMQVFQFGLSAFVWDASTTCYRAHTFNIYVWPRTMPGFKRCFVSQAAALEFLVSTTSAEVSHGPVNKHDACHTFVLGNKYLAN